MKNKAPLSKRLILGTLLFAGILTLGILLFLVSLSGRKKIDNLKVPYAFQGEPVLEEIQVLRQLRVWSFEEDAAFEFNLEEEMADLEIMEP